MKLLILLFLLSPLFPWAQDAEYFIFESAVIACSPDRILQFESALATHNTKYHGPGAYGVRVFEVVSGPNVGKYMWNMGPTHWSALDARPDDTTHRMDWVGNVIPHTLSDQTVNYWRFHPDKSRFPKDFNVSRLLVWQVDIVPDGYDKAMRVLDKVHKVHAEKMPEETYGVYTNELSSTSQGNDLSIIWFFGTWGWMNEDSEFETKFNEVHGAGSWEAMMTDWMSATQGIERELWVYREELSGLGPMVEVAERQ